jgi:glucose 1-dehydrogenase
MDKLAGRTVVLTGATRGFGNAMARAFLEEGANVMICGRGDAAVGRAHSDLGARASGLACDVADLDAVRALADATVQRFGGIDVWVNNAGISGLYGELETLPVDRFEAGIRTNILGCYHGTLAALEHMLPRRAGKIINIGGAGSDGRPTPFQTSYGPTKAWVQSFTLSTADEHKDSGVGIFVLNPGMMLTDLIYKVDVTSQAAGERMKNLPAVLRMLAQPPEVPARLAVRVASSATDGKTGIVFREYTRAKMASMVLAELGRRLFSRG